MPDTDATEIQLEPVRLAGENLGRPLGSVIGPEEPVGKLPGGVYCRGDVVYARAHAEKRVKSLDQPTVSIYCIPFIPGRQPPHDGITLSDTTAKKAEACIGSESEVELSLHLEGEGAAPAGTKALFKYCGENRRYLYIVQKITFVRQMRGRKGFRVIRKTSYESFKLDEFGTAELVDPHSSWAPYDDYCRLTTDVTAELELIWKAPLLGTGRFNEPFEFYGFSRSQVSSSSGDSDPDTDSPTHSSIFLRGVRGFKVFRLHVKGSYAEHYEVDHCKGGGGGTSTGRESPRDDSEPMKPVELSPGSSAAVASRGEPAPPGPPPPAPAPAPEAAPPPTPEQIEERIRAAL